MAFEAHRRPALNVEHDAIAVVLGRRNRLVRCFGRPSRGTPHDRPGGARAAGRAPRGVYPAAGDPLDLYRLPRQDRGARELVEIGVGGLLECPLSSLLEDTRSARTWSSGIGSACVRLSIAKVLSHPVRIQDVLLVSKAVARFGAGAITPWRPCRQSGLRPHGVRRARWRRHPGDDALASMSPRGAYAWGS